MPMADNIKNNIIEKFPALAFHKMIYQAWGCLSCGQ